MAKSKINWTILLVVFFAAIALNIIPNPFATIGPAPSGDGIVGPGFATGTLNLESFDFYKSTNANVNAELWDNTNTQRVAEASVTGITQFSTSAPTTLDGYVMMGNDDFQSGTDRGSEVYYTKQSVSWVNEGTPIVPKITVYNESTPTWTGYDDGTGETTLNVSVGSGATVTSTELKIAAGADACVGNPEFGSEVLAVCFNVSGSGATRDWEIVRPTQYTKKIDVPDFLSGHSIIDSKCYVLPTNAVCDYGEYRFYIVMEAASGKDPVAADRLNAILLDKAYGKNDDSIWTPVWGDDSATGTDKDVGIDSIAQTKEIGLT